MIYLNEIKDIEFCKFSTAEVNQLEIILNQSFYVKDFGEIIKAYSHFSNDFDRNNFEILDLITIAREKIIPRTTQVELIEKFEHKEFTIGIDLPTLLRPVKSNGRNVFIIAEDALRTNQENTDVILSTPFGTHVKDLREKKLKNYWGVIQNVLNNGYSVYLTDAFKFWIKNINEIQKINFKGDILTQFQLTLLKEINSFNPSLIITFGNVAHDFIDQMLLENKIKDIAIINFPHPTPTANGKWAKILKPDNCTVINKVLHMNSKIDTALLQFANSF